MPNQRQYYSRDACTQLLGMALHALALGVLIAALGYWGHELVLVAVGLSLGVALPCLLVHWIVELTWPDSRFAFSMGPRRNAILTIPVSSLALCPATPPPRPFLAL